MYKNCFPVEQFVATAIKMIPSCLETLQALDPGVRPYVKYLLTQDISRLSITNDPVLVTDPCSG